MATVSDLVRTLTDHLGEPEASVRQRVRELQNAGRLPVASGRTVPPITPRHVALAILAVLVAPVIKDTNRMVEIYADLAESGRTEGVGDSELPPTRSAADFLEATIADIQAALANPSPQQHRPTHADATYEVCLSWPEIRAHIPAFKSDGTPDHSSPVAFTSAGQPAGHWQGHVRKSVAFGGYVLGQIASELAPSRVG